MIISDPGYALAGKFDPMLPLGLTLSTDRSAHRYDL